MDKAPIKDLLKKQQAGKLTDEERAILDTWYVRLSQNETARVDQAGMARRLAAVWESLEANKGNRKDRAHRLWPRIAAAATVIVALAAGSYLLVQRHRTGGLVVQHLAPAILPGSQKAVLTLSNGKQIDLSDAAVGRLAQQGNVEVIKAADGQVSYHASSKPGARAEVIYNTISTPRGGYYPLKMADGTIAVLDAASSISYPVTFTGKERVVAITGQVYFEVTHNAALPFKVKARGQLIEDLGTKFNVSAYDDEIFIRTTLVDGSVKVTKGQRAVVLRPGQQATAELNNDKIHVAAVDTEDAIAWKNGQTSFKGENIQEIMRQVSRWYDVDIAYSGLMPQRKFSGGISRKAELSDLLKILEFNNIHFTVDGKKITVRP